LAIVASRDAREAAHGTSFVDLSPELLEGLRLVEEAVERCTDPAERGRLQGYVELWRSLQDSEKQREAAELAISAGRRVSSILRSRP